MFTSKLTLRTEIHQWTITSISFTICYTCTSIFTRIPIACARFMLTFISVETISTLARKVVSIVFTLCTIFTWITITRSRRIFWWQNVIQTSREATWFQATVLIPLVPWFFNLFRTNFSRNGKYISYIITWLWTQIPC
jgi:hypothetical protein